MVNNKVNLVFCNINTKTDRTKCIYNNVMGITVIKDK